MDTAPSHPPRARSALALRAWVLFALFWLADATFPATACGLLALALTWTALRAPADMARRPPT